ncbi:SGNH/GDSL hydrolase family protein [Clostridium sp. E02]|uniref:SGNH/GDSL hydrolase family protein n=1 Tax=Clostridium sp. E02 TaxID=2487134 RepID=UPI000F5290DD|nr:SGNH/GDSL hydrolase family protein [Clostridium sp. E02]
MEKRGIHLGNHQRMKKVIEKAEQGKPVVLAFLGGSITQGSLSSDSSSCYVHLVYQWWKKSFPNAFFTYINAGIGGTTSLFGVSRVEEVLTYNPDFIILDFTVNDENTDFFMETYESLVRRLIFSANQPAVMALCNVYYEDGRSAIEKHKRILEHYQIPYVSMKETLYQDIFKGRVSLAEVTPDGLHPNDKGHERIANLIVSCMEDVKDIVSNKSEVLKDEVCPKPITKCSYERARRIQNQSGVYQCNGFLPDDTRKNGVTDVFKGGFIGVHKGDRITFHAQGSCLGIQYRKTVNKPAPVAVAYVDGNLDQRVLLDGNFDEDWGDCLAITPLLHHGRLGNHEVVIELITGVEEKETPFYLVSLIQSEEM